MRNEARMVSVGRLPNTCFEARFFVSTIIERLGFAAGIFLKHTIRMELV
jgi:hypothetical protein